MVGRGTRLCPNLLGVGKDRRFFCTFDFCQNLEFFSQDPETTEGSANESLSKKLFTNRVELIAVLDAIHAQSVDEETNEAELMLRSEIAERLLKEVAAMNVENFLVRPKRRSVERFATADAWAELGMEERTELLEDVAGLPSMLPPETPDAREFDLLLLRMQLTLLRHEPGFEQMRKRVQEIARLLEAQAAIPAVSAKLALIQEVQKSLFWEDLLRCAALGNKDGF